MKEKTTGKGVLILLITFVLLLQMAQAGNRGVVKTIPAPDFPYGLTYDGTYLWVGTSYANTAGDFLWKIDPADGSVVGTIPIPEPYQFYKVKGLAFDGQYLWVFEDISGTDKFYKVDPNTGAVLKSFPSPHNNYVGGITYANGYLWFSNYYGSSPEGVLTKIDTTNGTPQATIVTQGEQPMGVAFDGQFIWCAEDSGYGNTRDEIYQYDPSTLTYTGTFIRNPIDRPRDMTWDGNYLWLVKYNSANSEIYQIDISGGTPDIFLPVTSLDFGLVSVGDTLTYSFMVQNLGTAPLSMSAIDFDTSAYFSDVSSFPVVIPTGGSFTYHVSFTPQNVGPVPGIMTLYSNDPIDPVVQVPLSGQGQFANPTIWLSASSHDFGNVWVAADGKANWRLHIANTGNQNLEIVDLILNNPVFSVSGFGSLPIIIVPNDTVDVTVSFLPTDTLTYLDTLLVGSNDPANPFAPVALQGRGILDDYTTGYVFWNYQVPDNPRSGSSQDYEVDGLQTINDINGDGVGEVVIATENYWLLCLDGNSSGAPDTLWSFNTYISNFSAGSIGQTWDYGVQDAIDIASDLNGDGYNDVVIATGGGNEHVYAINGTNGEMLWQYGTDDPNSYGLGDFEAVDAKRDFTGDGVPDVLAIADGNTQGTGYKKAYLFNGATGNMVWNYSYPGPDPSFGKTIISTEDLTGDQIPDAVIAVGSNGSSNLKTYLLNGATGLPVWDHAAINYEPKELLELPVPGQTPDIIVGEYFNTVQRLDGETGVPVWTQNLGSLAGIIQMDLINDVNGDGISDVLIASFTAGATCLSGADGAWLWSWSMDFQYGISSVPDLNGDGFDDVIVASGTNNPNSGTFYCLSGKGDSLMFSYQLNNDRAHTVNILPSIDGNGTYELLLGTKFGKVICFSGGVGAPPLKIGQPSQIARSYSLEQNYPNPFNPVTRITFTLPRQTNVTLKIFNVLGQEVATLLDRQRFSAGVHFAEFNGRKFASGIYLYRLSSKFGVLTRRMVLMK